MECGRPDTIKRLRLLRLSLPQRQKSSHIGHILQCLEEGYQVYQFAICRVADPAFNGYRIICTHCESRRTTLYVIKRLTFVKDVTHGRIIQNHNFAQIWLHLRQIFNVSAIPERAVLPVISS